MSSVTPEEREARMARIEEETEKARLQTEALTAHLVGVLAQIRAVRSGQQPPSTPPSHE